MRLFGDDFIGGSNYHKVIKENYKCGRCIGVLIYASGWSKRKAWKVVKQALKYGKAPIIKVIGEWKDDHRFDYGDVKFAKKNLKKLVKLTKKYPDQQIWYNPWLEYQANTDEIMILHRELRDFIKKKEVKNITLVYNPMTNDQWYPKGKSNVLELHNEHYVNVPNMRQSFSYDGKDQVDSDIKRHLERTKDCEVFWSWDFRYNGKYSDKDTTPRKNRKAWVDKKLLESLRIQTKIPKGDTDFSREPYNTVFKTHAENHGDDSYKAEKLVIQTKLKGDVVKLKAMGDVIATSRPGYWSESNKAYIYRFNEWGIDLVKKATKNQPLPMAHVHIEGTWLGKVNVVFRDGYYRFN